MKQQLLFVFLTLLSTVAKAQSVTVQVSSSTVSEGEVFKIVYSCNSAQLQSLTLGKLPQGVSVEGGPMTSQSSSIYYDNGHMTSNVQTTIAYYLCAQHAGEITIPAAKAIIGSKTVSTPTAKITVTGSSSHAQPRQVPQQNRQDEQSQEAQESRSHNSADISLRPSLSKTSVYEQEALLLTYKLYSKTKIDIDTLPVIGIKDCKVEKIYNDGIPTTREGDYIVGTLGQYIIFPKEAGKIEIPPVRCNAIIRNDPYDPSFIFGRKIHTVVEADGLSFTAKALPETEGKVYGVGKFAISAQADRQQVKAGDPISLRVIVDGTGNLNMVREPQLTLPDDFEKYAPKTKYNTRLTTRGFEGSIVYDYVVVPRHEGSFSIPAIELKYFDTDTKSYKTLATSPIPIEVEKGEGATTVADYSTIDTGETDIRGIALGEVSLQQPGSRFFNTTGYFLWLLLPILFFNLIFAGFRKYAIDHANIAKMRGKKANKVATRRLQNAAELMRQNRQSEFYDEVLRALWGYVGDKLNIPVEQLTKDNIADRLAAVDINAETIETFIQAIDDCEYARYAPGDPLGKMDNVYGIAITAITDIESMLKLPHHSSKKKTLLLIAALLISFSASAATKQEGDKLYGQGKYNEAIAAYNEILSEGVAPEIYYNLGNAYYRTNNITKAILAYERALRLSPGDEDIRYNLKLAQTKTIDKITPGNRMFFVDWYHSFINFTSADNWAVVSIVFLLLMVVSLLLYFFVQDMVVIRVGFYSFVLSLVVFIVTTLCAVLQTVYFSNHVAAIVVAPSVEVKQTPDKNAARSMMLHEGTRAEIVDSSMKDWVEIRTADGRQGWLKPSEIEKI